MRDPTELGAVLGAAGRRPEDGTNPRAEGRMKMVTFNIGDKVYYRINFGRGPDIPGTIIGVGKKNNQVVYDVELDRGNYPQRWGYTDQFRKR